MLDEKALMGKGLYGEGVVEYAVALHHRVSWLSGQIGFPDEKIDRW